MSRETIKFNKQYMHDVVLRNKDRLKIFFNLNTAKKYLADNDFDNLFRVYPIMPYDEISSLTALLLISGIDFLSYMENIPEGCFAGLPVVEVYIPNNIKMIGEEAFALCEDLKKLYLPDTLLEIAWNATQGCDNVEEIRFAENPSSITTASYARDLVMDTLDLKCIVIPKGVKEIDWSIFRYCDELKKVVYEGTYAEWENISQDTPLWDEKKIELIAKP